jgi:flavodoxin
MNRRAFITSAGAGLVTVMLGGCSVASQDKVRQNPVALAATDSNTSTVKQEKKILIAYYSYSGHTRAFAEIIQKEIGGDLFAIEPLDAYPTDYDKLDQQAKIEAASEYKPKLINNVADIRSYDIVFIGTPIWWYTVAPPVRTFLTDYDLAERSIIPFSTHKGSGLSGIDKVMQKIQLKAKVLEGFAVWDDQAINRQAEIANWLHRLNL